MHFYNILIISQNLNLINVDSAEFKLYNCFMNFFTESWDLVEKYAWKATVKEGCLQEYCRRHNEIWQEMKDVLNEAGIVNYTIWNVGNELFGYYECTKGAEYAAKVQAESEIVDKWNEYMKDVMVMEMDPITGAQPLLEKVFEFN